MPNTAKLQNGNSNSGYRIVYGDTLSGIARKFGVSVEQLAKWNNILNVNRIYAGQRLIVKEPAYTRVYVSLPPPNTYSDRLSNFKGDYNRPLTFNPDSIETGLEKTKINWWNDQRGGYFQTGGFGIGLATRARHIYGNIDMSEFGGGVSKGFLHKGAYVFRYAYEMAKKFAFYYGYFGGKRTNINSGGNNEEKPYVDSIPVMPRNEEMERLRIPIGVIGEEVQLNGSWSGRTTYLDTIVYKRHSDSIIDINTHDIFAKKNTWNMTKEEVKKSIIRMPIK
jgi:hypothetical protein